MLDYRYIYLRSLDVVQNRRSGETITLYTCMKWMRQIAIYHTPTLRYAGRHFGPHACSVVVGGRNAFRRSCGVGFARDRPNTALSCEELRNIVRCWQALHAHHSTQSTKTGHTTALSAHHLLHHLTHV